MPDLEMPGNTAIACDKPIKMAIFELIGKDLIFIFDPFFFFGLSFMDFIGR